MIDVAIFGLLVLAVGYLVWIVAENKKKYETLTKKTEDRTGEHIVFY